MHIWEFDYDPFDTTKYDEISLRKRRIISLRLMKERHEKFARDLAKQSKNADNS